MAYQITVGAVDAGAAGAMVEGLADVLVDCVDGGASVSFMAPMARQQAVRFWQGVVDGVARGERILLVARDATGRVAGTVQLVVGQPPNQPHRADVSKLLVHRDFRRQGVGRLLMEAVDQAAAAAGKSVLVLDTETGGDAERLYERSGWTRAGVIPDFALKPHGGLCATTFFYKQV
ncbi:MULTISPECIES: GNAT family N-acetyltransferase [unclassified Achromobacter]|uniref:GNAT family N-acetyltransferase n=1 Tax=unclassified Achromobacter TaxID=2626865 RepID=UPI000B51D88C|nr:MULTISPECIES: GNAT family N-acetyltransferase [unclassified Achromobacter]OWT80323.1 GNAT family N-acetyltransferase [Achromobacter sp. HZ34]OWT82206.1 GNAT family N-acetyltransferase [Achromobacter sp. HZ28]